VPRLACLACGQQVYTVAPVTSLFLEERSCPRCGKLMQAERRESDRRQTTRRGGPDRDSLAIGRPDRRVTERRVSQRRVGSTRTAVAV
jgi:hypothetical protein